MEVEFQNMSISNEEMEALTETAETTKDSVSAMNEKEMEQHLQLCMKLSAENKINSKNAFGLHLIGLLRRLVNDQNTDLQFASLSLQASSKIYSGRVDALYKETFQFHNHLQTILSGGKKNSNDNQDVNGEFPDGDDLNEKAKTSQKKKFKSYVATEESISLATQAEKSTKPHQNFELIKAAFSGTTTSKKLLNCLQFEDDSCEILFARSSKIHKPKKPISVSKYTLTKAEKNLLEKTTKLASEWDIAQCEDSEMSRNLLHSPNQSLASELGGSFLGNVGENVALDFGANSPGEFDVGVDTDSLVIGNNKTPLPKGNETNGLEVLNERFCALDITVGSFVDDISQAFSKDGVMNPALLPPQSALRRVLKTAEKNTLRKEVATEKKKKEIKPREPFFRGQEIDNSLFMPGKRTVLAESAIACWDKSETTELGTSFDTFDAELDANSEIQEEVLEEEFEELPYTVMAASEPYFALKNPFIKRKPVWKLCRETKPIARKESSPGIFRRIASMAPQPEQLADSFRNMTINDSFGGGDVDDDAVPPDTSTEDEEQVVLSDFADDIQLTLVAAPELVKPINVRPQQKAMYLDTQKVKHNMWSIISTQLETDQSITFSNVCSEINKEVQSKEASSEESISWQFAFVMLLDLANEKCLLLENVGEGMDLVITKDVSEIDV